MFKHRSHQKQCIKYYYLFSSSVKNIYFSFHLLGRLFKTSLVWYLMENGQSTLFTTKKFSIRWPLGSMMSPAACTASGRILCTSCAITPVSDTRLLAAKPAWSANSGEYLYLTTLSCWTFRSCSRVLHCKKAIKCRINCYKDCN